MARFLYIAIIFIHCQKVSRKIRYWFLFTGYWRLATDCQKVSRKKFKKIFAKRLHNKNIIFIFAVSNKQSTNK